MLLLITLILAAVFSGAALLVTVAEQPARLAVNRRLKALTAAESGEARTLIVKWGKLHAVRTALGIAATIAFALASYFSR